MLVLRRKLGERIVLSTTADGSGPKIEIVLLAIESRDRAKIGILAPEEIIIAREELLNDLQRPEGHQVQLATARQCPICHDLYGNGFGCAHYDRFGNRKPTM